MKAYAQQRYRNGPRTRVRDGNTPIPNWAADSRRTCINNKKELFSFINWQICKSGVNRTLLLNAHFFRRHISTAYLPTGIFMYQNFNRSSRPMRTPLLHMDNETVQGHSKACDRTLDSDIVVLADRLFETPLAIRVTGGLL